MANAPLAHSGAELLFQVLDEHSVLSSIVMTTNFRSARTETFPDSRVCKAIIDGSTFNAHIIGRGTESWRFKKPWTASNRKGVRRKTARSPRSWFSRLCVRALRGLPESSSSGTSHRVSFGGDRRPNQRITVGTSS
jgi:hypothetical protein